MSEDARDDKVRERARDIWEQEGQPSGKHDEHWARAEREIDAEEGSLRSAVTESIGLVIGEDPDINKVDRGSARQEQHPKGKKPRAPRRSK